MRGITFLQLIFLFTFCSLGISLSAAPLPANGEWDGVTPSAHLDGPYENPTQAIVPFGIVSYFNQPWRAYMDTWPASQYLNSMGTQWNVNVKYEEALCQLFQETGLTSIRYEIGWGNMGWDDELSPNMKAAMKRDFVIYKKYGIRPLILLNAHHGVPCPVKNIPVEVAVAAKKGDHILKLAKFDGVKPLYTGIQHPDYIANYPTITSLDPDGTAHFSAALPFDIKAGQFNLVQTKYQPFQGSKLKDGTPVPAAQETVDGWMKYVESVAKSALEALGTAGQPDAGFDIEVWNEQTFGSNFLNINNYYEEKIQFAEPYTYTHTREMQPGFAPDARLKFTSKDAYVILPMTIDWYAERTKEFPGVRVISGFSNQWPWDNGKELWDHQAGFSRHYYTGGWFDVDPEHPINGKNTGNIDAQGNFDGTKDNRDWHTIVPGTNFVPTLRIGFPEFMHSGFKTEMLSRDITPDSRWAYMNGHGRYTHNGDFHTAQVWQTEVNYDRNAFADMVSKAAKIDRNDPRMLPVMQRLAGKSMLRQYLFHAAKGLYRIYIFSPQPDPNGIGTLPQSFYDALDKNDYKLNDEVRKQIPPEFTGLTWLTKLMKSGEELPATRNLRVNELVEYQPRLLFAGDGTPAHPNRWFRDQFAFMPYQLSANKFVIPYYVMTIDMSKVWDEKKEPLDPARYDMPVQDYEVTIGNVAGRGATATAYDPLSNTVLPVKIVAATPDTLTVRLQTTDYPRILTITEAKPGPQILEPKVALTEDNSIMVSWKSNIPVKASLSYGIGWQLRDTNTIQLAEQTSFTQKLPASAPGVVAVRIKVTANGLTTMWPRWDEDPQGQVVIPGDATTIAPEMKKMMPRASEDFLGRADYESKTLPTADNPAWSYTGTGAVNDFAKITIEGLLIDTSADPANNCGFHLGNMGFKDSDGFTVEMKVKVTKYPDGGLFSDGGLLLQVFGEQNLMQIDLSDKQICIRNGATLDLNFADDFHIVRAVMHAGEKFYDVYLDGKLLAEFVPAIDAGANAVNFGNVHKERSLSATIAYLRIDNTGAYTPTTLTEIPTLSAPKEIKLGAPLVNEKDNYSFSLPEGITATGNANSREATLPGGVNLRVRYFPGGMKELAAYLPFTSPIDTIEKRPILLPSGAPATLYAFDFAPTAHPGMTNLRQLVLTIKLGGDNLLLLTVDGTPAAMNAQQAQIRAIFASIK